MRHFSIPYNNDQQLLNKLANQFPKSKKQCKEVFFAIPGRFAGTGRVLKQTSKYEQEIINLIKNARENEIESNLLINSGCLGLELKNPDFIYQVTGYIYSLKNTAGLDIVTVSDYYLAKEIKKAIPEIKLECSSIAYVDSLERAKYWEEIGSDMIVVPPVMNKNLQLIQQLRENLSNVKLKLVVNQECLHGCPLWHSHHNMRGHGNEGELYLSVCQSLFKEKPWTYYSSSYIPPKYLSYYDEYIDIYKLVDRRYSSAVIMQSFGSYCGEEGCKEKMEELNKRIPEDIFAKVIKCNKNCSVCNLCEYTYKSTL